MCRCLCSAYFDGYPTLGFKASRGKLELTDIGFAILYAVRRLVEE